MEYTTPGRDLKDVILNDYMKEEYNKFPHVPTVGLDKFPKQNTDMIDEMVPLWYMDERFHEKKRALFRVVRWDLEEPNNVILVNDDLQIVLISRPEHVEEDGTDEKDELGLHIANRYIHQYPIQNPALLGIETTDRYMAAPRTWRGVVLRADEGGMEPQVLIFESKERIVTLKETKVTVQMGDIKERNIPLHERPDWWPDCWREA